MKYLVASDIHGSKYYAEKLACRIDHEMVDEIVLLGDLYYHGPRNPLPKDYDPMAVCDILNRYKDKTISAKGNCDAEVDVMISKFPCLATIRKTIHGKRYMFTHGHKYNMECLPANIDILVHGHTHISGIAMSKSGMVVANPGSVSIPKGDTTNSYMIVTDHSIVIKDLDGEEISRIDF